MRGPIPGIARIWASVAVLMLIGTIAAPLAVLLLALVVVDAVAAGAIEVSPTTINVSAGFSDLAVQAASATMAESDSSVGRLMKRIIGSPVSVGATAYQVLNDVPPEPPGLRSLCPAQN